MTKHRKNLDRLSKSCTLRYSDVLQGDLVLTAQFLYSIRPQAVGVCVDYLKGSFLGDSDRQAIDDRNMKLILCYLGSKICQINVEFGFNVFSHEYQMALKHQQTTIKSQVCSKSPANREIDGDAPCLRPLESGVSVDSFSQSVFTRKACKRREDQINCLSLLQLFIRRQKFWEQDSGHWFCFSVIPA